MGFDVRNFLELKGGLIYLKKLDPEYADEYWTNFNNCSIDFLVFSKQSNKAVDEVVLNDIYRNNRSANLRIFIDRKEDFNKGYGSEASQDKFNN